MMVTRTATAPERDRRPGSDTRKQDELTNARDAAARHYLGLRGASHLHTLCWMLGRDGVLEAVEALAIASVTGPPGTGKTHLLNTVEPEIGSRVVRVEFGQRPTMRSVTTELLQALTGVVDAAPMRDLIPTVREALCEPVTVIVDEAQRLNRECLDHLRFLHDHRSTQFALILAGGEHCWDVLGKEPQLRRRIYRPCFFRELTTDQVRQFIPRFHPVWAEFPQPYIDRIDAEFAGGLLGHWAAITKTVEDLVRRGLSGDAMVETALCKHGIVL